MTVRARLYDARGDDRDVDIRSIEPGKIDDRALLWIDVDGHDAADIDAVARAVALEPRLHRGLAATSHQPRVIRLPDRVGIALTAIDRNGPNGDESLVRRDLDVVVGRNLVITVHDGPLAAIRDFDEQVGGERDLGLLDAGAFMAGLVDAVFATYLGEVEDIEREIGARPGRAPAVGQPRRLPGPRRPAPPADRRSCGAGSPPTATRSPR